MLYFLNEEERGEGYQRETCVNSSIIHIKVCMWQMDVCVQEGMPVLAHRPQKDMAYASITFYRHL